MLAGRSVATADATTLDTPSKVEPPPVGGKALDAPAAAWRQFRIELIIRHVVLLLIHRWADYAAKSGLTGTVTVEVAASSVGTRASAVRLLRGNTNPTTTAPTMKMIDDNEKAVV